MQIIIQDIWVLLFIPLIVAGLYYAYRKHKKPGFDFSSERLFIKAKPTFKMKAYMVLPWLRILAVVLCFIALARPQTPLEESKVETEGVEIVLAVDISGSMKAEDFTVDGKRANRLEAVKQVVERFVEGRHNDRIGLIAFAGRAYTVCPLTLDYGWLLENLERLSIGMIEDGTAIGSGLSTALNRLKDTEAKSKIIILLTDGRNNAGDITPKVAAEAARALDIKVYTIGAGKKGNAPYPVQDFFGNTVYQPMPVDIDEETLKLIAEKTGGMYFRATDTASLKNIYEEIDRLETTPIEEKGYLEYKELYPYVLILALFLLLLEIVLGNTLLRRLP